MKNKLYILDSDLDFLQKELKFLSKNFDFIYIIVFSQKRNLTLSVKSLSNVNLIRADLKYTNIYVKYLYIFRVFFWKELYYIKKIYKLDVNKDILIQLLNFIYLGESVYKYLRNIIKFENEKTYIYSFWFEYYLYGALKLKKQNKGLNIFTRAHGYDLYFERGKNNYLPMRKYILNKIDRIYFISKDGLKYFTNKICINNKDKSKLFLSKLGVNSNFNIKNISLENKNDIFRIVTCSSIIEIKRLWLIVRTLSNINYNIEWIHFGDGIDRWKIIKLANELLSNKKNIKYIFKGKVENQEVYDFYRNNWVDVFINVSKSEGIPISIMEACSFGIPIIATDVGGNKEIVSNKNGFLIPSNPSTREIKEAIDTLYKLNNEDILIKRINSYKVYKKDYKADTNYTKFANSIIKM